MKVLLFANDLMPFGPLPTSGGGLRCYQLMKGLQAHGVEVFASMPGFTFLAEKHFADIPEEQRDLFWRWDTQDALVRRIKPDAVLFASNWDHFNLAADHDIPVIIDLHGSRLIETTMWGNPVSTDHKVRVLSRADCLLCAGRRQRSYFNGWLIQAGRFPRDEQFIRYVPISLGPDLPKRVPRDPDSPDTPYLVSGGGWFPWQNQSNTILAACREVVARQRGVIELYGTPHETPTQSPAERVIRDIYRQVQKLAELSPRVRVQGYVGRDRLIEIYRHASVALEAMQYNLERELAFTTRTIEYLWCGLPVMYNDYAEISEHIREYDAGWIVNPDRASEIDAALEEIFSDPAAVERKSANAQRLVRDRFVWDKTVLPLLDFIQHPHRAPKAEPVVGLISTRPSYFGSKGAAAAVPLRLPNTNISQAFMIPADHTRSIELPFSTEEAGALANSNVTLRVKTARGVTCAKKTYQGSDLAKRTHLEIAFPWYRRVRGGERFTLHLRFQGRPTLGEAPGSPSIVAHVGGMKRPVFPLLPDDRPGLETEGPVLALSFAEGPDKFDRIRIVSRRALDLIRRGQIRVLVHAVARRLPHLAMRVRRRLAGAA